MSQDALRITAKKDEADATGDIVFLCHNSKDKEFIRKIADALELEFGTRFFLDVFTIPTGEEFIPWIEKALEECATCAIFLGANGWGPTHLWEAELALARYRRDPRIGVIPVALPGISREEAAKLGSGKLFQDVNWADFTKGPNDKESLEKLEAALTGRKTLGYRGPARLTPYQVRRDADRWERSGRKDRSILYTGKQLVEAATMERDNPDAVMVAAVTSFLAVSRERERNFWRRTAIGATAVAAALLISSAIAVASYLLAEQRRLASVSRQLAIASSQAAGADRALLIAARAVLVDDVPEARGALLEQLQNMRFLRRIVGVGSYVEAVGLGPDGRFLFGTANGLRTLARYSAAPALFDQTLASSNETVTAVVAAEGSVWLGHESGSVSVVTGSTERTLLDTSRGVPPERETRIHALAYDKSKRLIAVGTGAGRIAIVRLSKSEAAKVIDEGVEQRINSLSFDPTRPKLAVGTSAGTILIIDTNSFKVTQEYPRIDGGVLALGYVNDGSLAVVGGEGKLLFFDGRNPKLERPTTGDGVPLATAAAIDPVSSRVAVGDSAGTIRLYDAATGKSTGMEPLLGHSDSVTALSFGAERDDLASASSNGTVALWDLAGQQGPADELPQLNPSPLAIRSDRTGRIVAVSAEQSGAEVRRLEGTDWKLVADLVAVTKQADNAGTLFREPHADAEGFVEVVTPIPVIAVADDGRRVAWSTSGGAILALSTDDPSPPPGVIRGPGRAAVEELAISGDGGTIAAIEAGGARISLYEIGTPSGAPFSITPPAPARSAALDHDGKRLAVGMKDGKIVQYSAVGSHASIGESWSAHASEVAGLMYSRDGNVIVTYGSGGGGADRTVAISNTSGAPDPRSLPSRQAAGSVSALSLGLEAGLLAVGDHDGQVLTWSAADGRYFGRLAAGTSEISALLVDDEHARLLTASGDGSILSWSLDPMRWVALACAKANRPLTRQEWRELLPDDDYVSSCTEKKPLR
ncbi:toll/interleukin-1 receptor domain-containing protein [Methylocapsa sp. S129]|uniref:toll/interleukin-1 receptor domain-containing protein n=1 Tax=Methylocapsa sp. S129 TaxID=1641869 RepID=UPI00131D01E9|nr:TIR domain-containing protein [Methylocapsa sp. S129]